MSPPYRVVFDINVYVDTIKYPPQNTSECFISITKNTDYYLVYSKQIIKMVFEKLKTEENYSLDELKKFNNLIRSLDSKLIPQDIGGQFDAGVSLIGDLKHEDSYIYRLAQASEASIIVTSDRDFDLVRNFSRDIAIVSPARFIKLTSPKKPPTKPSPGLQFGINPLDFQLGQGGLGQQI